MKIKSFIISIFLCIIGNVFSENNNYVSINGLFAESYPAHVELNWKNNTAFTYEIFRSVDGGKKFVKLTTTTTNYYLDFFGKPLTKEQIFIYRVLPKGFELKNADVSKFETKVTVLPASDEALLDMTQRYTTRYFYDFAEPTTGMARERSNDVNGEIVTTGGTGFGIMALIAGAERNYLTRNAAFLTIHKIVTFLEKAERFHGAWAHWYDARSGKPFNFSKYDDGGDLVETALLTQGLLTARQYFMAGNKEETLLSNRITQLWETVEWSWYTQGSDSLYWHWSKNHGWKMNHRIKGFDETLITYVLAASSPTFPIKASVYESCFKNSPYYLNGKSYYGIKLDLGMEYGGPLFFAHYSFLGLNPNGLSDKHTNYFERNKAHVLIQRAYAINNPKKQSEYDEQNWGLSACYGGRPPWNYMARSPRNDDGVIAPTAALSSYPYTPFYSTQMLFQLAENALIKGSYGFADAYSPETSTSEKKHLAIDQGPIVVMIENYRTGLIWNLLMKNTDIKNGLSLAGISTTQTQSEGFNKAIVNTQTKEFDIMRHPDRGVFELDYFILQGGSTHFQMKNINNKIVMDTTFNAVTGQNSLKFSNSSKIVISKQYTIKLKTSTNTEYSLVLRLR